MTYGPTRPFGYEQSPIQLFTEPVKHSETPLNIKIQWSAQATGRLNPINPARSADGELKVSFDPGNHNIVTLNGTTYELAQFHFHCPGEHTMGGGAVYVAEIALLMSKANGFVVMAAPMELHMVFMTNDKKAAVVLAVMVYSGTSNASRDEQASIIAQAIGDGNGSPIPISLVPAHWLPQNLRFAYRYHGSLTTPNYEEIVSWVIVDMPLMLSPDVFNFLTAQPLGTARPVQPLNGREVTYYPWPPNAITTV